MNRSHLVRGICAGILALTSVTAFANEAVRIVRIEQDVRWNGNAKTSPATTRITLAVLSSGCTGAESFALQSKQKDGAQYLTVVRTVQDNCKAMPREIEISLSTETFRSGTSYPIHIQNPVLISE